MKKAISLMLITTLTLLATMSFSLPASAFAAENASDKDVAKEGAYVEDEVLVVFDDTPSKKEVRAVTEEVDAKSAEEIETPEKETPYVLTLDEDQSVEDAVEELEKESSVAYAQPNFLYGLEDDKSADIAAKASPRAIDDTNLWNLNKINAKEAWELIDEVVKAGGQTPREKVTVAVLDTGVNLKHPDLQTALKKKNCVNVVGEDDPMNYLSLEKTPKNNGDEGGHGTKVSGIIAATSGNGIGVAGVASGKHNDLVELAVIDVYARYNTSKDRLATSADIIKGINYACETAGAKVINMSLGHHPGDPESNSAMLPGGKPGTDSLLEQTIHTAVNDKKVTIVCSAGNKKSTVAWLPSDFDDCISVISTTNYSDAFSLCKAKNSNYGWKKDISAPGESVSTTFPSGGYTNNSSTGTSMAAPVVSGVAAMLYYLKPSITPQEVRQILTSTATDLYTDGDDIYTRYGNVNALAAVSKVLGRSVPSPGALATPASVKASSSGYDRIKVSWNRVSGASGYQIHRATSASGTFKPVATVSGNGTTSYTNTGLKTNTTYYYKVKAFGTLSNKKAYSPLSGAKSAKPTPAVPQSLNLYHTTYKGIKLKWKKVSGASGYGIYRATSKNGKYTYVKRIKNGSTLTYTNSGLKANKNYYYKVRAYRTVSGKRIYGSYSSVKQLKTTPAKTYISLKKNKKQRKAIVTWKRVSTVSGYVVYRATSKNGKYKKVATKKSSSRRSFTSKRLKKGKNYYYKARAYKTYRGKRIYGPYSDIKKCRF
ncbi:S8 family serine peptidase [Anaerovorax odorimutans]|uniref:S8 family serine peptidase n=1 Tax=Anaerovorax odorimutans TaxID=109327 RepID=A0ABT1RJA6_9FIRM|nr:S8 family serine peptidase [Anaerovorax odorimutans]MCQ4635259.1 S8 family serine peptidase [Anaerovorax odorimutans]